MKLLENSVALINKYYEKSRDALYNVDKLVCKLDEKTQEPDYGTTGDAGYNELAGCILADKSYVEMSKDVGELRVLVNGKNGVECKDTSTTKNVCVDENDPETCLDVTATKSVCATPREKGLSDYRNEALADSTAAKLSSALADALSAQVAKAKAKGVASTDVLTLEGKSDAAALKANTALQTSANTEDELKRRIAASTDPSEQSALQARLDELVATRDDLAAAIGDTFSGTEVVDLSSKANEAVVEANFATAEWLRQMKESEAKVRGLADKVDIAAGIVLGKGDLFSALDKEDKQDALAKKKSELEAAKAALADAKKAKADVDAKKTEQDAADKAEWEEKTKEELAKEEARNAELLKEFEEKTKEKEERLAAAAKAGNAEEVRKICMSMNRFLDIGRAEECLDADGKYNKKYWHALMRGPADSSATMEDKLPAGIYRMDGFCSATDWNSKVFAVDGQTRVHLGPLDTGWIDTGSGIVSTVAYHLPNSSGVNPDAPKITVDDVAKGFEGMADCHVLVYEYKPE
jgi:hypothetical protein